MYGVQRCKCNGRGFRSACAGQRGGDQQQQQRRDPHGKRNSMFTCTDTKKKRPGCMATCPNRCKTKCLVLCPTCKTFCLCDFYPGVSCGDPRFTGADGNNFYFHGKKDQDFCIVSDKNLHINAHFIGNHNPDLKRDFTWIQALGVLFSSHTGNDHHTLHLGAVTAAKWDSATDHLNITFDDERVVLLPVEGARWSPSSVPALSVTRTTQVNTVVVELKGVFRIMANAVPITKEESRVHNYGVTDDDSLVHLDLGFKFQALTDDVHGVLGQTYRADYVNRLDVAAKMPIMVATTSPRVCSPPTAPLLQGSEVTLLPLLAAHHGHRRLPITKYISTTATTYQE
ncbi:hypothetical protein PR202_gb25231 [Eleusine coracana subsp. coracana]|uniref:Uncharacterized protein n=1 Tax=Eleusine coracana subsp. coracana TaxID=191504 RepID=A0AAV5FN92_ELECO|nr:hypothetical protein PR202_gb25231 [Eleusine coracana subsp. coracana]